MDGVRPRAPEGTGAGGGALGAELWGRSSRGGAGGGGHGLKGQLGSAASRHDALIVRVLGAYEASGKIWAGRAAATLPFGVMLVFTSGRRGGLR